MEGLQQPWHRLSYFGTKSSCDSKFIAASCDEPVDPVAPVAGSNHRLQQYDIIGDDESWTPLDIDDLPTTDGRPVLSPICTSGDLAEAALCLSPAAKDTTASSRLVEPAARLTRSTTNYAAYLPTSHETAEVGVNTEWTGDLLPPLLPPLQPEQPRLSTGTWPDCGDYTECSPDPSTVTMLDTLVHAAQCVDAESQLEQIEARLNRVLRLYAEPRDMCTAWHGDPGRDTRAEEDGSWASVEQRLTKAVAGMAASSIVESPIFQALRRVPQAVIFPDLFQPSPNGQLLRDICNRLSATIARTKNKLRMVQRIKSRHISQAEAGISRSSLPSITATPVPREVRRAAFMQKIQGIWSKSETEAMTTVTGRQRTSTAYTSPTNCSLSMLSFVSCSKERRTGVQASSSPGSEDCPGVPLIVSMTSQQAAFSSAVSSINCARGTRSDLTDGLSSALTRRPTSVSPRRRVAKHSSPKRGTRKTRKPASRAKSRGRAKSIYLSVNSTAQCPQDLNSGQCTLPSPSMCLPTFSIPATSSKPKRGRGATCVPYRLAAQRPVQLLPGDWNRQSVGAGMQHSTPKSSSVGLNQSTSSKMPLTIDTNVFKQELFDVNFGTPTATTSSEGSNNSGGGCGGFSSRTPQTSSFSFSPGQDASEIRARPPTPDPLKPGDLNLDELFDCTRILVIEGVNHLRAGTLYFESPNIPKNSTPTTTPLAPWRETVEPVAASGDFRSPDRRTRLFRVILDCQPAPGPSNGSGTTRNTSGIQLSPVPQLSVSPGGRKSVVGGRRQSERLLYGWQLVQQAVLVIKPTSLGHLPPGTRVCAPWSDQLGVTLYPGTVVAAQPGERVEDDCVPINFDDGDHRQVPLSSVHLLPAHFTNLHELGPSAMAATGVGSSDLGDLLPSPASANYARRQAAVVGVSRGSPKGGAARKRRRNSTVLASEQQMATFKTSRSMSSCSTPAVLPTHSSGDETATASLVVLGLMSDGGPVSTGSDQHSRLSTPNRPMSRESSPGVNPQLLDSWSEHPAIGQPDVANPNRDTALWRGLDKGRRRHGSRLFYRSIQRQVDGLIVSLGDVVQLRSSNDNERFIGEVVELRWDAVKHIPIVKTRWFYRPSEAGRDGELLANVKGALFATHHSDENEASCIDRQVKVFRSFTAFCSTSSPEDTLRPVPYDCNSCRQGTQNPLGDAPMGRPHDDGVGGDVCHYFIAGRYDPVLCRVVTWNTKFMEWLQRQQQEEDHRRVAPKAARPQRGDSQPQPQPLATTEQWGMDEAIGGGLQPSFT